MLDTLTLLPFTMGGSLALVVIVKGLRRGLPVVLQCHRQLQAENDRQRKVSAYIRQLQTKGN